MARRARADDGTAEDIRELVPRILTFVDTPRYDLAEIVTLAKATTQIVDLPSVPLNVALPVPDTVQAPSAKTPPKMP